MENAKSIIDIQVNDDQFKRFKELFDQYSETLGEIPSVWKDVTDATKTTKDEVDKTTDAVGKTTEAVNKTKDAIDKTAEAEANVTKEKEKQEIIYDHIDGKKADYVEKQKEEGQNNKENLASMKDMLSVLMAHSKLMNETAEAARKSEQEQKEAAEEKASAEKEAYNTEKKRQDQIANSGKIAKENYSAQLKAVKKLSDTLTGIVGTTASIGFNVAKWGIGGAIGLLGGSAFGLERLGANATQERTQSRILGVSPGQLRAWHTDFGNYGNPDSLLSSASNAPTDAGMRALYMRAGVSASTIREGNTSDIAQQALRGLSEFFNRNKGPNAQAVWQGHGFDQIMSYNDMRGFAGASPAEQDEVLRNLRRDTSSMNTSDPTMKAWQDFYTQLQRVGEELKTTFLDGLVGLSGPIKDLAGNFKDLVRDVMGSDGFKNIIEAISQGLESLGGEIKNESFQKGLENFVNAIGDFAKSDELKQDLEALRSAIHLAASAVKFVTQSPLLGGSGWGGQKATGEKNGQIQWEDDPSVKKYGFGDFWNMLKSPFSGGDASAQKTGYTGSSNSGLIHNASYVSGGSAQNNPAMDYLRAIAMTESGGNPNAQSKAGAQGMFQLMPSVQEQYGVTNPFDPQQSMMGASSLIRDLVKRFHGDMTKVTAAYNAGGGRVSKAVSQYGDSWLSHLPNETQNYVDKVSRRFNEGGGLSVNITNSTGGSAVVTARQSMSI